MRRKKVTLSLPWGPPLCLPSLELEGWGSLNHPLKVSLTRTLKQTWMAGPLTSSVLQIKKAMVGGKGLRKLAKAGQGLDLSVAGTCSS